MVTSKNNFHVQKLSRNKHSDIAIIHSVTEDLSPPDKLARTQKISTLLESSMGLSPLFGSLKQ